MDKKWILFGFVFLVLCMGFVFSSVSFSSAVGLPDWKDRYVNDFGGVFNSTQVDSLRALLVGVDNVTTAQVVVVTDAECTSRGGPSQYAFDLANKWGIGDKEKDNGLLVLYCVGEKKIFVASGYGLEGILPDSKIGRLLDENYVPLRDAGDVQQGIINFVSAVSAVILENKDEVFAGKAGGGNVDWGSYIIPILFVLFVLFSIFSKFKSVKCKKDGLAMKKIGRKGNHDIYECPKGHVQSIAIAAASGFFLGRGIGGFGGHGGGGFGGGFGGGSFGGGGAGR